MNKSTTVIWCCPRCDRSTSVTAYAYVPARVSGPPERCNLSEGGTIEPAQCSHCDAPIDAGTVFDMAQEQEADALAGRADELADRRRDEGA